MEEGPAATTRDQRRSVNRGSANSQIVAYTEGELRSNPGGARERYFVISGAFLAMVTELDRLRRRSGLERGRISGDLQHVVFAQLAHHLRHEGGPRALAGARLHVIHLPHEVAR